MSDKYKNGKIYTIRCKNDDTLIYVGSTVQPLFKRWHHHKTSLKNKNDNMLLYQKMRETNIEDWYIELYEKFSCENKEQLNKREGQIIREISSLNKRIEGRTLKEYYEDNKDKFNENAKKYYEDNKEKIKEYFKEYHKKYYDENKEKVYMRTKKYRDENKEKESIRKKKYRDENKDKIKEIKKKYYEENKEKLSEKITCDCGSIFRKSDISKHRKTLKHISFLDNTKIY